MTTVYVVRHALAEGNIKRIFHGHTDGQLEPQGLAQLPYLAERFRVIHLDAVYSSDLSRARQTAAAVAETHQLPVFTTPRLREIYAGKWEGHMYNDLCNIFPEQFELFTKADFLCRPEGGESIAEAAERMCSAVADIVAHHDGGTVAVFSHGCAIRSYLTAVANETALGRNTGVSKLEYDGDNIRLVYSWDISHLEAMK